MNVHEYQAKVVLSEFGVCVPRGGVAHSVDDAVRVFGELGSKGCVVKAQIHAGGRGKAGGVKLANSADEVKSIAGSMLGSRLVTHQTGKAGQIVKKVYIEEALDFKGKAEYYISAVVDRSSGGITFVASVAGGMDIEEVAAKDPSAIVKVGVSINTGFMPFHGRKIAYGLGLRGEQVKEVSNIASSIYKVMINKDAGQVEINPMVELSDGRFVALDAKVNFDDNALVLHNDIVALRDIDEEVPEEVEASKYGLNYIKMDGSIGCMVNGAGLAMATMDIVKYYGSSPANFLDVGGGAKREAVVKALKIILSDNKVKGVLVNIFGGIMRCDIIAQGIVDAINEVGISVPLVVRLSGTNFQIGKDILLQSKLNVIPVDDLDSAARKIVEIVGKE